VPEALDVLLDRRLVVLQPPFAERGWRHALFLEGEDRVLDVLERERLGPAQLLDRDVALAGFLHPLRELLERDVARAHLPRDEKDEQVALDEVARDAAHLGDPVGLGDRERAVLGKRERSELGECLLRLRCAALERRLGSSVNS
jgi:hypothetical protein